ncbi:MAG: hypothetical protein KDD44_10110, partial [Bdellovibrionales bacterium]|nr:hypothetical protein [Bdellovibrionales bacterium]
GPGIVDYRLKTGILLVALSDSSAPMPFLWSGHALVNALGVWSREFHPASQTVVDKLNLGSRPGCRLASASQAAPIPSS